MLLLLTAVALAAPVAGAPVELRLWHAYRGDEAQALEDLAARWTVEHPEAPVAALAVPYEGFVSKLEAAAPRGNGPDLFIAAHERSGAWANRGLLSPWADVPAGLHPTTVEALRWEGQVMGLPLATKCLALFSNDALVDAPPATTDALLALGDKMKARGGYALAYPATEPFFHAPWLHGFGGGVFQGDAVRLDQPGNAASLDFARSLTVQGIVPEEPTTALVTQLFNSGAAATVISGPWFLGEIDPSVRYTISTIPTVSATGHAAAPFLTVEAVFVSGFSTHPEEAREFARWLVSGPVAVERALVGRQVVATLSAYDDPRLSADPVLSAFRAQLDHSVPMSNRPEMASTWEPMALSLRRVMRGASGGQEAVLKAQHDYTVLSRPPPPPAEPTPYLALGTILAAGLLAYLLRDLWRARGEVRASASAYAWVAPAALSMLLLVVTPFVVGAGVSLFEQKDGEWIFVGLANFWSILSSADFPVTQPPSFYFTLAITVLWTLSNVVLHVFFGVSLAMLLREPWLQLRAVYRVLLVLPWAVPNYITALIWKGMFHRQFGAINALLAAVGLEPVSWFSQFSTAFAANLTTNTWLGFPFMMVVTLGALQAIPRELEQAAEVDGATGWQRFRHVTLPLLKPALLPAVILGSVWTFNMFNIIYLVSGGEPDGSTEILISEAYRWAFSRGNRYGYAAAYALIIFAVLLFYSRVTRRLSEESAR